MRQRESNGDAVRSFSDAEATPRTPIAAVAFALAMACSGGLLMEQREDFTSESRLAVTLVQQRTPLCMHFFLDFIFH
jgi:hypothetical protein